MGIEVGSEEGTYVGDDEGLELLGARDMVGTDEGAADGTEVGFEEGPEVGTEEGTVVGLEDGQELGIDVLGACDTVG